MKQIIHFKIPLIEDGRIDRLAIGAELTGKFMQLMKRWLGEDYCVVASPFDPSVLALEGEGLKMFNFDMQQISVDELIELAEKEKSNDCTVL